MLHDDRPDAARPSARSVDTLRGHVNPGSSAAYSILIPRFTVCVALIFAAWIVATTLYATGAYYSPLLFWDAWHEVGSAQHIDHLFDQSNEHRLVVSRLVFIADEKLFGGGGKLNLVVISLMQAAHAVLLVYLFARARPIDRWYLAGTAAFVTSMLFWLYQTETLAWSYNVHFAAVFLIASAAFAVLALWESPGGLATAMVLGTIGAFTMANGIFILPLLISLAIWLGRPWWQIAVLALGAAFVLVAFLAGYHIGASPSSPEASLAKIGDALRYALAFLGAPFGYAVQIASSGVGGGSLELKVRSAIAVGAAGLVLFAGSAIYTLSRRGRVCPARLALVHIMMFVVVTMILTTLGRWQFGITQAFSPRYGTPALVFWTALGLTLWSFSPANSKFARNIALTAIALVGVLIASTQVTLIAFVRDGMLSHQEGHSALLANVHDEEALRRLYSNVELIETQAKLLRAEHLSIFARPWSAWLGSPLTTYVGLAAPERCAGYLDEITPIAATVPPAWRARGWAWDPSAGALPEAIILADERGAIVGFGLLGYPRPDVQNVFPEVRSSHAGWKGHFSVDGPRTVRAYALLADLTLCPLRVSQPGAHDGLAAIP